MLWGVVGSEGSWGRGGEWGADMLKVRGSAMQSLSGLSVLTSPAGCLPERLSVRAADLSQAHHTVQGRVRAPDRLLASLAPVTHSLEKKDLIKMVICRFLKKSNLCWGRWLRLWWTFYNEKTYTISNPDTWSRWAVTVYLITNSWMTESMNTPSVHSPVVLF